MVTSWSLNWSSKNNCAEIAERAVVSSHRGTPYFVRCDCIGDLQKGSEEQG